MNRKYLVYIFIAVLGIGALLLKNYLEKKPANPAVTTDTKKKTTTTTTTPAKDPASTVDRNRGFDRRTQFIEYTQHAKCRMNCRHITQTEVEEIMRYGSINYNKSDVNARPCPEYALEGETSDGQKVRIVYAQCDYKTKVVTTIDLKTNWSCDCPGDDKKHGGKKGN